MARFVLEVWVNSIVAKTPYSLVLAQTAVLRSSEINWSQPDCPGWYRYDYHSADVRKVLPTNRGRRNYLGSKPRARGGVKLVNLFDV